MTKRVGRLAPALILALCQLSLLAQSTARQNGASTSWADEILKKETYATPPPEPPMSMAANTACWRNQIPSTSSAGSSSRVKKKTMKITVTDTRTAVGDAADEIIETGSSYRIIVVTDEGRSRLQRNRANSE